MRVYWHEGTFELNWISAHVKYKYKRFALHTHTKSHSVPYEYNIVTQNINMHHRYSQNIYCDHRTNFWQYHGISVHAMPHHHLIDMDNILWRSRKKCLITLCAFYLTNDGYEIDSTLMCQGISAIPLKKMRLTKKFAIFLWENGFSFTFPIFFSPLATFTSFLTLHCYHYHTID